MASRSSLITRVADLVGRNLLEVIEPADGWPGLVRVQLDDRWLPIALHIGPIGLSHRNRDDVERRFQNPGQDKPIRAPAGFTPLLLGVWEDGARSVLVAMNAAQRLAKNTRQSLFIPLWLLQEAATSGWAEHISTSAERIVAFHPALLPTYLEVLAADTKLPADQIVSIIAASGLLEIDAQAPEERARRATMRLVRSAQFSKRILEAYGRRCAMCGLNYGLIEAAHIYPAHAPGSQDEVWNGLALCRNHHGAFDKYLIWVHPHSLSLTLHPELTELADNDGCRTFVNSTLPMLRVPPANTARPRAEMFERRYEMFKEQYSWMA